MSVDKPEVIEGEIVEPTALAVSEQAGLDAMVKDVDKPALAIAKTLDSFDWRDMKPQHMALLLMQKPFAAKGGGAYKLNFAQALFFATRCYELGLSPFSSEVFFDAAKWTVGVSYEGKKQLARNRNIDMGPPQFERKTRQWSEVPDTIKKQALVKLGHVSDVGYECKIRVGNPEHKEFAQYLAWGSEWFQESSPVWKEKFDHMLQTRAAEKATTLAMGTGASDMPD